MYYLWLILPALLLSIYAQAKVTSTFSKYSKVMSKGGYTGAAAARKILDTNGLTDIDIFTSEGTLSDNYNPKKRTVNLSHEVHSGNSVASIGVAAHETGHALQDRDEYGPLKLRAWLVPLANIGSMAGPYIVIAGLLFSFDILTQIGIVLFSAAVAFYLVTLPVELNASRRALEQMQTTGILQMDEIKPAKKVLNAAALTYVAAALSAVTSLIRLVLISRDRR